MIRPTVPWVGSDKGGGGGGRTATIGGGDADAVGDAVCGGGGRGVGGGGGGDEIAIIGGGDAASAGKPIAGGGGGESPLDGAPPQIPPRPAVPGAVHAQLFLSNPFAQAMPDMKNPADGPLLHDPPLYGERKAVPHPPSS